MLNLKIVRNPLIKIVGITAILYFALFYDKSNPNSLGNRLNSENLKKNFKEVNEKSSFIAKNLSIANQAKTGQIQLNAGKKEDDFSMENNFASCGDEILASYVIYDPKTNLRKIFNSQKIILSDDDNAIFSQFEGMAIGEKKDFSVFENNAEIKYQIRFIELLQKAKQPCKTK